MGPLRDDNGRIEYLFILVQDVTEIAAYEEKLIDMNTKDGLTGIYNRRFFERKLAEEFERYKRYDTPFSLVIQDIDFFKKVNDQYGHPCGDHILKAFTGLITTRIRETDILARYGGEEFCCLLPETEVDSALKLAENIRRLVEEEVFVFQGEEVRITLSQGVATVMKAFSSAESVIKAADTALYQAKRNGRNRVVLSEEDTRIGTGSPMN
jgi:diguanylate cyclase (GGDEF)-like protein